MLVDNIIMVLAKGGCQFVGIVRPRTYLAMAATKPLSRSVLEFRMDRLHRLSHLLGTFKPKLY